MLSLPLRYVDRTATATPLAFDYLLQIVVGILCFIGHRIGGFIENY